MTLTTDDLVAKVLLKYNPLQGPILLDYLTHDQWNPGLVTTCFQENASDCSFPREELSMTVAAENFWRLVKKWLNPTQSVINGWLRDLMRHTIVMDDIFYGGQMPNHVMDDVHLMCGGILRMHGCVERTVKEKSEMLETDYANALKRGKREAMKVLLAVVLKGEREINLTKTNMELVDTLRKAVSEMWVRGPLHTWLAKSHANMEEYEMQEQYQVSFYKDGMTDHDEEQWLRYPSLIFARDLHLREDKINMEEIDLTVTTPDSDYWDRIKAFLFYSNVDEQLVDKRVTLFIEERTAEGGVLNWRRFHQEIQDELYQDVAVEKNNANHLIKYLEKGYTPNRPDSPQAVPHIQSGVVNDPGEETGPAKKDTESSTLTLIVFAAVIGIIFMQA